MLSCFLCDRREALERRGVDVSGVQVFAEGSRTPLPLTTDTYVLGGKTVRVRGECWSAPILVMVVVVGVGSARYWLYTAGEYSFFSKRRDGRVSFAVGILCVIHMHVSVCWCVCIMYVWNNAWVCFVPLHQCQIHHIFFINIMVTLASVNGECSVCQWKLFVCCICICLAQA